MLSFHHNPTLLTQSIPLKHNIQLDIKRLDLIHPYISGNKYFKLKYNILHAQQQGYQGILSFGGAYSNHIAALAHACRMENMPCVGIIRGEELAQKPFNSTLKDAQQHGMTLHFVSRQDYRQRHDATYLAQLQQQFPHYYIIPEGGTNTLAVQGCAEILSDDDCQYYDTICCAVGTGGTMAGLIERTQAPQHVLGFSALRGDFLTQDIRQWTTKTHWRVIDDYCDGVYAKLSPQTFEFMQYFEQHYSIPLDPIYTAKMMYGIFDLIEQGYFPDSHKILAIHSGGLQAKHSFLQQYQAVIHST
ncbi:MAG: pyridoxal-phosphate dependent enzyme [Acinetobacter sp.]|nr:pyridoxal-phosphate dependent enzyme [Acinetobacter sp.]